MEKLKDVNPGNVFSFIAADNHYKALLCTSINKSKSPHNFSFCALDYNSAVKPTIEDIEKAHFFGVGNTTKNNFYNYSEKTLEKMWAFHPEIKPYLLGTYNFIIWKKDFITFRNHFELIGNLNILPNIDKNGNGGVNASNWNYLSTFFNKNLNQIMFERGQNTFRVESIIAD